MEGEMEEPKNKSCRDRKRKEKCKAFNKIMTPPGILVNTELDMITFRTMVWSK